MATNKSNKKVIKVTDGVCQFEFKLPLDAVVFINEHTGQVSEKTGQEVPAYFVQLGDGQCTHRSTNHYECYWMLPGAFRNKPQALFIANALRAFLKTPAGQRKAIALLKRDYTARREANRQRQTVETAPAAA